VLTTVVLYWCIHQLHYFKFRWCQKYGQESTLFHQILQISVKENNQFLGDLIDRHPILIAATDKMCEIHNDD